MSCCTTVPHVNSLFTLVCHPSLVWVYLSVCLPLPLMVKLSKFLSANLPSPKPSSILEGKTSAHMHTQSWVMSNSLRPHGQYPTRLLCPWDFPGRNTWVGCHFLLQGIFPTQGWNPHLLHWQANSSPLCHLGKEKCEDSQFSCSLKGDFSSLLFLL